MIKLRTTLVLGAGASHDYGFPLGKTLLKQISWLGDTSEKTKILDSLGLDIGLQKSFKAALHNSGRSSVDLFLERRTEFMDVGKAAIAAELICAENHQRLMSRDGESWYQYFFDYVLEGDVPPAGMLSVVTFNYERSFEQYLHTALRNCHNLSDDAAWTKVETIPIVHVHGQLGQLRGNESRPYDSTLTRRTADVARRGIKIMHEGQEDSPEFCDARKLLSQSEVVAFLGFGFHPTNTSRLQVRKLKEKHLCGTAFGLELAEVNDAHRQFPSLELKLGQGHWTTLMFLRQLPFWV